MQQQMAPPHTNTTTMAAQNVLTDVSDPALRPGPRGRAVRRWRAAKDAILMMGPDKWDELEIRNQAEGRLRPFSFSDSSAAAFAVAMSGLLGSKSAAAGAGEAAAAGAGGLGGPGSDRSSSGKE